MPSFLKFADFLQNEKDLTSIQKEALHSVLFQSYQDIYVNAADLSFKIKGISLEKAYQIIKKLILENVFDGSYDCPACDSTLSLNEIFETKAVKCPECGQDIQFYHDLYIKVFGNIPEKDYEKLTFDQIAEIRIKNLAKYWRENGGITYFLLDLVNSELIQKENEREYNSFLSEFREFWVKRVLSQSKENHYFIGEIGDAYKIIFQDIVDAFNIVRIFSQEIINFDTSIFENIKSKFPIFPKFKIVIDCVNLPTDRNGRPIDPGDVFIKTANRTYDINSASVTQLYRAEAKLKEYKDSYYKNWEKFDIALWLMDSAFEILSNYSIIPESEKNLTGPNLYMLKNKTILPIEIFKP
ncbi:hypothetical protein LEP1GSC034_4177 [Leptospira interrogans str. 2003000735]|uniref:Uncharacterized protein n=4 Tax=Leptospira interrogans TaxID=173 RepID=A0A829CZC3_LEPIR|nr:hypothetical protein [Leptospira interrogans]EMF43275.1 hypothetical protein LEP1GSC067_4057 [Leptospira interrogans serovar Lora str. TE 1992]EMY02089.1 hypothetical protein LEP1GSC029_1182 [Leptospira interrogans str. 2002000626]EMY23724.1 hypothetical protein LEP1GSC115_0443 [Leptospira interrogans serovar Australis str. 200703203]AKH77982.1 hypothetical protein BRAT_13640 [Leptospira interrogans serovar Bratislava]EKN88170.1 hypothetical protein LEP1GSC027_4835 [Leptospira interrogans s